MGDCRVPFYSCGDANGEHSESLRAGLTVTLPLHSGQISVLTVTHAQLSLPDRAEGAGAHCHAYRAAGSLVTASTIHVILMNV